MKEPTFRNSVLIPACCVGVLLFGYWMIEHTTSYRFRNQRGAPPREAMTIWIPLVGVALGSAAAWLHFRQRLSLFHHGINVPAQFVRFTSGGAAVVRYEFGVKKYQKLVDIPSPQSGQLTAGTALTVRVDQRKPGRVQYFADG